MRRIILGLAVSLDGLIEGPNGEYDWCFTDQDYGMSDFFNRIDSIFIGRKSYEMMQGVASPPEGAFPKLREYVFSTTLNEVKGDAILIRDNIRERVNAIRQEDGKDIWLFGGAGLTSTLMQEKLVDELWLSIHPILLGKGKPLFADINARISLRLIGSKVYDTGLVSLSYEVL